MTIGKDSRPVGDIHIHYVNFTSFSQGQKVPIYSRALTQDIRDPILPFVGGSNLHSSTNSTPVIMADFNYS